MRCRSRSPSLITCKRVWWDFWNLRQRLDERQFFTKCPGRKQFIQTLFNFAVDVLCSWDMDLNLRQEDKECFSVLHSGQEAGESDAFTVKDGSGLIPPLSPRCILDFFELEEASDVCARRFRNAIAFHSVGNWAGFDHLKLVLSSSLSSKIEVMKGPAGAQDIALSARKC